MAENTYRLDIQVTTVGGGGGGDPSAPDDNTEEAKKSVKEKIQDWYSSHKTQVKAASALAFATGVSYASKAAGYAGNYIQQNRIQENLQAIGLGTALVASVARMASGDILGGAIGLAGTSVGVGMSIWSYHENIRQQNLQAAYQATYNGARMERGRV